MWAIDVSQKSILPGGGGGRQYFEQQLRGDKVFVDVMRDELILGAGGHDLSGSTKGLGLGFYKWKIIDIQRRSLNVILSWPLLAHRRR